MQIGQKLEFLAKNLNMAKNSDFAKLLDSQISNGQNSEFWTHSFNLSQNSETFKTFYSSEYRAVKNQNFNQKFKHGI